MKTIKDLSKKVNELEKYKCVSVDQKHVEKDLLKEKL
jgi:hypothetical protein